MLHKIKKAMKYPATVLTIAAIVTIILLGLVFGMRSMGDEMLPMLFPSGLSTHNMAKLFAFIALKAFWGIGSAKT